MAKVSNLQQPGLAVILWGRVEPITPVWLAGVPTTPLPEGSHLGLTFPLIFSDE